tara:strand:- start:386 stop:1030 length:645 start_codon:yes stop_codon:yes gene_type:complete
MKKILLYISLLSSFIFYNSSLLAISISLGSPATHSFGGFVYDEVEGLYGKQSYGNSGDKTNGYFLGVLSTYDLGFGIDRYTTKFKTGTCAGCWASRYNAGLKTKMTNIFYQLPIRVLNIIVGIGTGTTEYDCTTCSTYYDKGSATQWFTSFGMSIISSLEIQLSYRSVNAKNIKNKYTNKKDDNSGSVTGIGLSFNFAGEGGDEYDEDEYDEDE